MNKIILLFLMIFFAGRISLSAHSVKDFRVISLKDSVFSTDTIFISTGKSNESGIICLPSDINTEKREKLISAMLAFPFPFGFMGAHRVMLGSKPWVPVVYMATFGGCFGLLPMIDFCVILLSKDIGQFENNPHVFMWLK